MNHPPWWEELLTWCEAIAIFVVFFIGLIALIRWIKG